MANRRAFKYMIAGFLLVLLDVHIFFDFLPDPLGYILIASGIHQLAAGKPNAKKAVITAYVLMALSIPTLFLSGEVLTQMQVNSTSWLVYGFSITLIDLILMYYIFRMLMHEVDYPIEAAEKQNGIKKIMIVYMTITLTSTFIQSFLINMNQDVQSTVAVAIIVLTLSVHVAFILTLRNLQKTFTPDQGRVYPMERPN